MIHIIGDSHARLFENDSRFGVCYIPEATAHNLMKPNSKSNSHNIVFDYLSGSVNKDDYAILVFGEIDCRFNFYYQSKKQNRPICELIDDTIARYSCTISTIIDMGYNTAVFNIVPAGDWNRMPQERALFGGYPPPTTPYDMHVPIYTEFHYDLSAMCCARGFKLIDVWDDVIDERGHTKDEYVGEDPVHLNKNALPLIVSKIRNVFGEII